jgi:hypothetical protein
MPVNDGEIEVVAPRAPEGLSLVLKPYHGARLYKIVPVRDPNQPRFWCLIVLRCNRSGAVEENEEPWIVSSGLSRDQLPSTLTDIQTNLGEWLAHDDRRALRAWLLERLPDPLDVIRACGETRRRTAVTEDVWEPDTDFIPILARELAATELPECS